MSHNRFNGWMCIVCLVEYKCCLLGTMLAATCRASYRNERWNDLTFTASTISYGNRLQTLAAPNADRSWQICNESSTLLSWNLVLGAIMRYHMHGFLCCIELDLVCNPQRIQLNLSSLAGRYKSVIRRLKKKPGKCWYRLRTVFPEIRTSAALAVHPHKTNSKAKVHILYIGKWNISHVLDILDNPRTAQ